MTENRLTQEQVDALVGKGKENQVEENFGLTNVEKDVIGEVGNISMSTAATTLSSILNHRVEITTPKVSCVPFQEIIDECEIPKVVTSIQFKEGLSGQNLLMVDVEDAMIIANLMMGGDGENIEGEFGELELSAVGEAMNQMIGSASTSMSKMLFQEIDIYPPDVAVWDMRENIDVDNIDAKGNICKISFDMTVDGLIESEIMQVFARDTVEDIIEAVMGPIDANKEDLDKLEAEENKTPEPQKSAPESGGRVLVEEKMPEEQVEIKKPVFQTLNPKESCTNAPRNLDLIMDVPLEFSAVLGKNKMSIKEILSFTNGSIIELDKLADEPLEIYVNEQLIAQGEVVVINENFGIRITNILTKEERVKNLG